MNRHRLTISHDKPARLPLYNELLSEILDFIKRFRQSDIDNNTWSASLSEARTLTKNGLTNILIAYKMVNLLYIGTLIVTAFSNKMGYIFEWVTSQWAAVERTFTACI